MKTQNQDLDWTRLFQAFHEALEWTLDVAARLARHYPEEVAAIERVRRFARARIAGDLSDISIDDVLFTFALVVGAIDHDKELAA